MTPHPTNPEEVKESPVTWRQVGIIIVVLSCVYLLLYWGYYFGYKNGYKDGYNSCPLYGDSIKFKNVE